MDVLMLVDPLNKGFLHVSFVSYSGAIILQQVATHEHQKDMGPPDKAASSSVWSIQ
jgi:hypothetical protein